MVLLAQKKESEHEKLLDLREEIKIHLNSILYPDSDDEKPKVGTGVAARRKCLTLYEHRSEQCGLVLLRISKMAWLRCVIGGLAL
jgi:hypothetical protein